MVLIDSKLDGDIPTMVEVGRATRQKHASISGHRLHSTGTLLPFSRVINININRKRNFNCTTGNGLIIPTGLSQSPLQMNGRWLYSHLMPLLIPIPVPNLPTHAYLLKLCMLWTKLLCTSKISITPPFHSMGGTTWATESIYTIHITTPQSCQAYLIEGSEVRRITHQQTDCRQATEGYLFPVQSKSEILLIVYCRSWTALAERDSQESHQIAQETPRKHAK